MLGSKGVHEPAVWSSLVSPVLYSWKRHLLQIALSDEKRNVQRIPVNCKIPADCMWTVWSRWQRHLQKRLQAWCRTCRAHGCATFCSQWSVRKFARLWERLLRNLALRNLARLLRNLALRQPLQNTAPLARMDWLQRPEQFPLPAAKSNFSRSANPSFADG